MLHPLVPVAKLGLVPFDADAQDCPELIEELNNLKKEHDRLVCKVNEVTTIVDKTVSILNDRNRTLAEEVDTYATFLQAQLDIEDDDENQNFKSFFDDIDSDDDMDSDYEDEMAKDDEREVITNRDLRRTAKALFKKIANLTHPDKVGHSRFVDIYKAAYDAAELCDISTLEDLLKSVKESKSIVKSIRKRIRRDLEMKIAELRHKISKLSHELEDLVESEEYDYSQLRLSSGVDAMVEQHTIDLKQTRYLLRAKLTARGFDPDNLPL